MKKLLAVLLCAVMTLSAFSVTGFAASAENGEGRIYYYETEFLDKYYDFVEFLADKMENFEEYANVSDYNSQYEDNLQLSVDDSQILHDVLRYTHPELFYFKSIRCSYYTSTRNISRVTFVYYNDTAVNKEQKAKFDARIDWYLSKVKSSMSDFEKALVLHDELCQNNAYELYDADGNEVDVYDLVVDGIGKCYCYAGAYAYLLKRVGINSDQILSDDSVENYMFHQWNKVQIDGEWYNVDVTWDDPVTRKAGTTDETADIEAQAKHTYFLLSDDIIDSVERFGSSGIHHDYFSSFEAHSTKYDDYSYHNSNSKFCFEDNGTYMTINKTGKGEIVRYDYITDVYEQVVDISAKYWSAGESGYWNGCYFTMDSQDGYIYYNTPSAIYVYDTVENSVDMFWSNTSDYEIYGTRIIDGEVFAAVAESPNYSRTLVSAGKCRERSTPYVTRNGDEISLTAEFTRDSEDTAQFCISNVFKNFQILGVQKKVEDNDGEESRDIRFVSVLKDEVLQDTEDYGFIAVGAGSMERAREIVTSLTLDNAPDNNVFSCKDTDNAVSGEYGVHSSQKSYKYVTFGVDNIGESGVAVVFYLKDTSGNVFYAPYIDESENIFYNCAADWAALIR